MENTREELGSLGQAWVEFTIHAYSHPEESRVSYYPDGSGYPGCRAYCSLDRVTVWRYGCGDAVLNRNERPDWFEFLDSAVYGIVEAEWDEYEQKCLEELAEDYAWS